eukprot:scaffold15350_cov98-Isochrysis_galbana.AAC.6
MLMTRRVAPFYGRQRRLQLEQGRRGVPFGDCAPPWGRWRKLARAQRRRAGRSGEGHVRGFTKGEDLLQRRSVVVLRREAQHAAGAREVGVRVVPLVAQVDNGVAAAAVVSIEEGPHLGEWVAIQRLDQPRSRQP